MSVVLVDDDEPLTVDLGDLVVFDPSGRNLPHHYVVGVVVDTYDEADDTGEDPAPLVRVNNGDEQTGDLVVVRYVKAVLA